ncbi:hypothetical protein PAXRUDRAFT_780258 [Paxillus rubicundulus Ve08.2h10]|uniref:Mitochondrial escape protein 2 n=1 Tax=Paxillus rubicundulus Ve08.2h10 TaxID=930991 RepID=A0A0D0DCS2_9AGAM|nr:hypothetical protein PAXRUDRAFT_780258 [Paxillus rubicundulus Ve08.2h10]
MELFFHTGQSAKQVVSSHNRTSLGIRKLTNSAVEPPAFQVTRDEVHTLEQTQDAWLFVDSVFPVCLGIWDLRHYTGVFRKESLLEKLEIRLSVVKAHHFKILSLELYQKDGGVFVNFSYATDADAALKEIENELKGEAERHGVTYQDMNRYPSVIVKAAFHGPDVQEEVLYQLLFRLHGCIHDISPPKPVPAGTLCSADISFVCVWLATITCNTMHGYWIKDQPLAYRPFTYDPFKLMLSMTGLLPIQKVLPIIFFLLGTLTYMVSTHALDQLSLSFVSTGTTTTDWDVWKEHKEAEMVLRSYLSNPPCYGPVFTFLNSLNNMIDITSMSIISQKGLPCPYFHKPVPLTLPDQLKQILEVVDTALEKVNHSLWNSAKKNIKAKHKAEACKAEGACRHNHIHQGIWHDGWLDCVSGNSIISELGIGDENFDVADRKLREVGTGVFAMEELEKGEEVHDELVRKEKSVEEVQAVGALPVVIIKNYGVCGGVHRENVSEVLGPWGSILVENHTVHVIIVSNNQENMKLLSQDVGLSTGLTALQISCMGCTEGHAGDLETISLIHKVCGGQSISIEDAVEDIISHGIPKLLKNVFGEDIKDAKSLHWTHKQTWTVLEQLSQKSELPYYDVLSNFPFKGDRLSLWYMEHVELISISTLNGWLSTICPGKPVLKYMFERLVNATQDMAVNKKLISNENSTITACEAEFIMLQEITSNESLFQSLWSSRRSITERKKHLLKKMYSAAVKMQTLEKQNVELRRVLAKGG